VAAWDVDPPRPPDALACAAAAVLLARIGWSREAALMAGAVVADRDRYPALVRNGRGHEQTMRTLRRRLGEAITEAW
jgi:hypothetical protein